MADINISDEFARDAYKAYHELFKHYSALLFRARISIVTAVFLAFAYLFGIIPAVPSPKLTLGNLPGGAFVAAFAAIISAVFYAREVAYIQRLAEVARSACALEQKYTIPLYFYTYRGMDLMPIMLFYLIAITGFFLHTLGLFARWPAWIIVAAFWIIPYWFLYHSYCNHVKKMAEFNARTI